MASDFLNSQIIGFEALTKEINANKLALKELLKLNDEGVKGVDTAKAKAKEIALLTKAEKDLISVEKDLKKLDIEAEKVNQEVIKTKLTEQKLEKEITKEKERLLKLEKKENELKKKGKKLTDEEIKANIKLKNVEKERIAVIKDTIVLENKLAGTEERLLATNRKLARQRKSLTKTDKNYERNLKRINNRIDSNNKLLVKNSDQLKKGRLQVGSYASGIKEAAQNSGLFGGVLSKLAAIQSTIAALSKKQIVTQKITTANTYKQIIATKTLTKSKKAQIVTQKILNNVLKASPLFVLGGVVAGLVATISRTQKNVDRLSDAMASMGAIMDIVIDRFSQVGDGLILIWDNAVDTFDRFKIKIVIGATKLKLEIQEALSFEIPKTKLTDAFEFGTSKDKIKATKDELKILNDELESLREKASGLDLIKSAFDKKTFKKELEVEIALAAVLNSKRRELNREQKIFSIHVNDEISANKKLQKIVRNKIIDDKVRLEALKEITKSETTLSEKKIAYAKRELALSLDAVELDAERLSFIDQLRDGLITSDEAIKKAEDFTLSSSAGEAALFNIIDKINKLKQEEIKFDDISIKLTKQKSGLLKEMGAKASKGVIVASQNQLKISLESKRTDEERIKALAKYNDLSIKAYAIQLKANIITQDEFDSRRLEAEIKVQQGLQKIRDDNFKKGLDKQKGEEDAAYNLEVFRRQLAIESEKNIDKRAKKEIELNAFKSSQLLTQHGLLEDEITLIEEREEIERLKILKKAEDEKRAIKDKAKADDLKDLADLKAERIKFAQEITNELGTELDKRLQDQMNALQKEESDLESSINRKKDKAADGTEQMIAFEERKLEENRIKQAESEKQAAALKEAIKLGELFLTLYESESKVEPKGAESRALIGIAKAKAITEGIKLSLDMAGYEDGGLVEGGEQVVRINEKGKEFVLDANTTSDLGLDRQGSSMRDFHTLMNMHEMNASVSKGLQGSSNKELTIEVKGLRNDLKNRPHQSLDIDKLGNIIEVISKGNSRVKTTLKTRPRL